MAGELAGAAWYELASDDSKLRTGLANADRLVMGSATKAGTAGGQALGKGLGAGAEAGGAAIVSASTSTAGKITGLFSSATGKISDSFKTQIGGAIGALGAAFAASKIIGFFGDAIGAASDLGETVSKVGVIFGQEALPGLEKWAEAASKAMGLSKQQALDAAATFATFGKSAGLAGEQLVGFSTELVALASDLASFHNAEPQEVIEALGAALRGESEPMRRFGVLLDDATLKARAMELGIISTTKNALTPQQKVLAAQAEILAQTSDAQGDFDRTSGSLANQQRILAAELQNVTAEIGEKLLPVMVELAHFANDTLVPALRTVADATDVFGDAQQGMAQFLDTLTATKDDVLRVKDALGIGYMEARDLVKQANAEMGLSAEEFANKVVAEADRIPPHLMETGRQALANWKQADVGGGMASDLTGDQQVFGDAADALTGELPTAAQEAQDAAKEIIKLTPQALADSLMEGQTAWQDAVESYNKVVEDNLMPEAERAALESELEQASKDQAAAYGSGDQEWIAAADAKVKAIEDRLWALDHDVPEIARRTGTDYADAYESTAENAGRVAGIVASRAVNALTAAQAPASTAGSNTGGAFTSGVGSKYYEGYTKGSNVGANAVAGLNFGGRTAGAGGSSIVNSWLNGMWNAYWARRRATIDAIANDAGNVFGRSLPRTGPLKGGLRSGGLSVGESWVDGLVAALRRAPERVRAPLAAAVPVARPMTFLPAVAAAARPMVTNSSTSSSTSSVTHVGGITINVNAPNLRGGHDDIQELSYRLATEIRLRAVGGGPYSRW